MSNEHQMVDTAALEEFLNLKREQERYEALISKARERRSDVRVEVFERVCKRYKKVVERLDKDAELLREKLRGDYSAIREALARAEKIRDDAQLEKEELEFRNALGELTDDDSKKRMTELEASARHADAEYSSIRSLMNQLHEVFPSGIDNAEHLTSLAKDPDAAAEPPSSTTERDDTEPSEVSAEDPVHPDSDAVPEVPSSVTGTNEISDATVYVNHNDVAPVDDVIPDGTASSPQSTAPDLSEAVESSAGRKSHDAKREQATVVSRAARSRSRGRPKTLVLPRAFLTLEDDGAQFPLGAEVSLGSGDDNQIHVSGIGVSRKHASIVFSDGQFSIRDSSRFGTFVNEERVDDKALCNGDCIRLGAVRMLFSVE